MKIYIVKPNFVSPDAIWFAKKELEKEFPGCKFLENQSGPKFIRDMVKHCDMLAIAVDESLQVGKGVYSEYEYVRDNNVPMRLFMYKEKQREVVQTDKFLITVTDPENYRYYAKVSAIF